MQAQLIPQDGSRPIPITKELMIVGRKSGQCDITIEHSSISKLHCAIAMTDGLLFIRDLGSTNGTKVNGQRVIRGALLPNDELAFAKFRFKVMMGPSDPNGTPQYERTEVINTYEKPTPPEKAPRSSMDTDDAED
jgi:pSer/pThr/pTyr-binding forkhead associated (FHA) protein